MEWVGIWKLHITIADRGTVYAHKYMPHHRRKVHSSGLAYGMHIEPNAKYCGQLCRLIKYCHQRNVGTDSTDNTPKGGTLVGINYPIYHRTCSPWCAVPPICTYAYKLTYIIYRVCYMWYAYVIYVIYMVYVLYVAYGTGTYLRCWYVSMLLV